MKRILFLLIMIPLVTACAARQQKVSEDVRMPAPDAAYYFIRGYDAEMSHAWSEAEQFYRQALETDPGSVYVRVQLGYVLYRKGSSDEALNLVEGILKDHPDYIHALKLLAEIYRDKKQYRD